ncbi:MAG: PEP-CTERM sorting domain-containing protein [Microcystaceae cyanobacterium]
MTNTMNNHLLNFAVIATTVAIPFVGTQANAAGTFVKTIDDLTEPTQPTQTIIKNTNGDSALNTETGFTTGDFGSFDRTLQLRNVMLDSPGGLASAQLGIPISPDPLEMGIVFDNGANVDSDAWIRYDFNSPIDLTMGGANTFSLNVVSADHSGQIEVKMDNQVLNAAIFSGGMEDEDLHWAFDDFTDVLGVDFFTSIENIEILINPDSPETDITIGGITTTSKGTPEPGTLLGLTFAGVAGLVTRRRRQN